MKEPAEPTEEPKHSRGFGRYVYWTGAILLLYVLSVGPLAMMDQKGVLKQSWVVRISYLYSPIWWAYDNTPLRKPLGMYFHLWRPELYDKHGDLRPF